MLCQACHEKMLRNVFYLLTLLLCIDCERTYDYLDVMLNNRPLSNNVNNVANVNDNIEESLRKQGQDIDMVDDKEPVAQIDVVSFIQSPNYDTIENNEPYVNVHKRDSIPKRGDFESLLGENHNEYENEDYLELESKFNENNLNENANFPKNIINAQPLEENGRYISKKSKKNIHNNHFSIDRSLETPEEKCVFKRMKFPFFSRDKTSTTKKAKANKKRKLFQFNSKKYKEKVPQIISSSLSPITLRSTEVPSNLYKVRKRSYVEKICPLCRRRFLTRKTQARGKVTTTSDGTLHNSRQYYKKMQSENYNMQTDEGNANSIPQNYDKMDKPVFKRSIKKMNYVRSETRK